MTEPITSCDNFKALIMNAQQQQQQLLQRPRPRPRPPQSQLPTALTVDDLANALLKTIFNPYLAWVLPIVTLTLKRDVRNPYFLAFTAYEALLLLIVYLSELNNSIAYGHPRRMDWEREVVLVAGGASGVGWEVARMYAEKGVKVAVVDIRRPVEGFTAGTENLRAYECDVSDIARLEEVAEQIRDDLGTPTILIHSIATTITTAPLLALPHPTIRHTLNANLLSYINLLKTFLPGILSLPNPRGGTLVTISSSTAHLHPAGLSSYAASKAALTAVHTTLLSELRVSGNLHRVKMLLVEPGQIATALFAGVKTPSEFFAPVLGVGEVAGRIVERVGRGRGGVVRCPLYAEFVGVYGVLPGAVKRVARALSGIDEATGVRG